MNQDLFRLVVIGYGRHGKDTVSELLAERYGYTFKSSSEYCAEHLVYPALKDLYGYHSVEECYNDRHNHRSEWYNLIADYNEQDLARLGRQILSEFSIYCGLRRREELDAIKAAGICDFVIWVDASKRLPPEDSASCTVGPDQADYIIDNNGDLDQLIPEVDNAIKYMSNIHT